MGLRLLLMVMLVVQLLVHKMVLRVLLGLGVLLSVPPALHHRVLGGGGLPQAMVCLDGSDVSSWVGMGGRHLTDGKGPGLASIVVL